MSNWVGSKFNKDNPYKFNLAWIAASLRNDFKTLLQKDGWKFSISKNGYSSIDITIKQMPKNALQDFAQDDNYFNTRIGYFDQDVKDEICHQLYEIANAYNYDNSDILTDYFDRNYYVHFHLRNKHGKLPIFV